MPSGCVIVFGIYEATGGETLPYGEIELRATHGNAYANQIGYKIMPAKPGQFQDWKTLTEAVEKKTPAGEESDANMVLTGNVVRNFLDCVKSRKEPWCPLEEGHRSTSFAHLANTALKLGTRIEWDPETEQVTNLPYANKLLHYE